MSEVFTARLRRRNSVAGSTPLITYYNEDPGNPYGPERVELSGISFGNWVDKTAGLLTDEILVEPGDRVRLALAARHPAHWVTLVWVAAIWRAGCTVVLDGDAAVEVVGPDDAHQSPGAIERIACSLHPLGLGFPEPLPDGVLDYGVEVRSHPDVFGGPEPAPADAAWVDGDRILSHSEVINAGGPAEGREPARRLVAPDGSDTAWEVVVRALVDPVLTGGSTVLVVGADGDRLVAIAAEERAAG